MVQQVQFVEENDDDKEVIYDDERPVENCSFLDKSLENFINKEKQIIQQASDTLNSTKECVFKQMVHFSSLPVWLQGMSNDLII